MRKIIVKLEKHGILNPNCIFEQFYRKYIQEIMDNSAYQRNVLSWQEIAPAQVQYVVGLFEHLYQEYTIRKDFVKVNGAILDEWNN